MRLATLKKRAEFQRVRGGGRYSGPAFVLEGRKRAGEANGARFGFTVTKKLGGAVVRNRMRRRLKAALVEVAVIRADPAFDYVVVARPPALDRPFSDLCDDFAVAFERVARAGTNTRLRSSDATTSQSTDETRPSKSARRSK